MGDKANEKLVRIETLFAQSDLPEISDTKEVYELLIDMRKMIYQFEN
ncbi:hypothetical protein FACS1894180_8760 [Bacteroidia bacterium]|nr:hypothetical protein FACS1894180_8760 [Bacteroidia bacterium]